jgi:FkbM family methyltransferase
MAIDQSALADPVVRLLARRTKYVEDEILGLSSVVAPGSVCVDVGAAAGLYTLALSRLVGDAGEVHSIEPLQFAHPVWNRVLGTRSSANVRRHSLALGREPGSGVMSVPSGRFVRVTGRSFLDWKTNGLGSNAEFARHTRVEVEVETLDGLCRRAGMKRLDFIKIDVEGAELQVLEGGEDTIAAFQPTLLIEIEARHTDRYAYGPDDIVRWFAQRDYTMHVWQGTWREVDHVGSQARNYLFRPAGAPLPSAEPIARPSRAARRLAARPAPISAADPEG